MREAQRRQTTLCRRRGLRRHTPASRWMHLDHMQVGDMHRIQIEWLKFALLALVTGDFLKKLILLKTFIHAAMVRDPILQQHLTQVHNTISFLIVGVAMKYSSYISCVIAWFHLDHALHDITPLEEARALNFLPHRNIRLADWDDAQCMINTSFSSSSLRRIYDSFNLAQVTNGNGYIRILTGGTDQHGTPCNYLIHSEELFLFFMTRCKKGLSITDMVNFIMGGYFNRWSYGWRWILFYLDDRYRNIIGHQGMLRFVDQFPQFFTAIENYVKKPKLHYNMDGDVWRSTGLDHCPYRIAFFVDCKIYRTNVPFSGPAGDYEGAPCKRRYRGTQEAFFTRYGKRHGLKVETCYFPNGITTMFGPVSCRRHDCSGGASVQDMSGLNTFLEQVQSGRYVPPYAGFGDFIYGINVPCIRTYYRAYFPPALRTEYMRICDAELGACRQGIEWDYGKTSDIFAITKNPDNFRLAKSSPVSLLNTCNSEYVPCTHIILI